jgi:catechol 2,3-dioxygenase-like lactoylglutathione lyase family enzyme
MLSHVHIGITSFERASVFYSRVMESLGFALKFVEPEIPWAGWKPSDADRPLFLVGSPFNGEAASPGNGQMAALLAPDREAVDRAPGLRPQYHVHYYGAYFRDPNGNKICVCCHTPEPAP